jgi:hypothetical protein
MTTFKRIAIAILLSASTFAISETTTGLEVSPNTKIVLPQEVQSFLQPAGQFVPRSMCIESCQATHTSCLSSARTDGAKAACEKQLTDCTNACPMNKS